MKKVAVFLSVLLLAALFASCDGNWVGSGDYKTTDYKIRGTWIISNQTVYQVTLEIKSDTIKIIDETALPPKNDSNRPFKGFTKDAPLSCYTESNGNVGELFITSFGKTQSVPYEYFSQGGKTLVFEFDYGPETFKYHTPGY